MKARDNGGRSLDIIIPGPPITKGSYAPYTGGHGKALADDRRILVWENRVRVFALDQLRSAGLDPYDCPVMITGELRMPRPRKSRFPLPATQTAKRAGGGDLDKLLRALGDGLQQVNSRHLGKCRDGVLADDSRIIRWDVVKLYETPERPMGAYLTIAPAQDPYQTDLIHGWKPATARGLRLLRARTRKADTTGMQETS
ncbi:RusA family crossover junction endodeoxyribonuclease [Bifidobacterium platyrrhinorum]|uniref:Uncharacterized protein n=1 Tax=Bifidobacterium platyrrhinorum TaxID=2661628 RepID=A0A6L9SU69_9BIFI|nr:RusA family crossover junction endodeoxyribonuclease [Bifidobacterium platyrrhinorum]NEG56156.1 hypothetical protein [Bifidobacterium platyrrhinorum]